MWPLTRGYPQVEPAPGVLARQGGEELPAEGSREDTGGKQMAPHDSTQVTRLRPVHAILAALLLAAPAAAGDERPNLVVLITDDGPTREELQYLPRLREHLFAAGIEFKRFVDTNPLCCRARASTLRGQYSQNTGIEHNRPPDGGFYGFHDRGLESETLAVWLQRATRSSRPLDYVLRYAADPPTNGAESRARGDSSRKPSFPAAVPGRLTNHWQELGSGLGLLDALLTEARHEIHLGLRSARVSGRHVRAVLALSEHRERKIGTSAMPTAAAGRRGD